MSDPDLLKRVRLKRSSFQLLLMLIIPPEYKAYRSTGMVGITA